jgi:hypothetical protein
VLRTPVIELLFCSLMFPRREQFPRRLSGIAEGKGELGSCFVWEMASKPVAGHVDFGRDGFHPKQARNAEKENEPTIQKAGSFSQVTVPHIGRSPFALEKRFETEDHTGLVPDHSSRSTGLIQIGRVFIHRHPHPPHTDHLGPIYFQGVDSRTACFSCATIGTTVSEVLAHLVLKSHGNVDLHGWPVPAFSRFKVYLARVFRIVS